MLLGSVSFLAPFLVAGAFADLVLDWSLRQAEIAGIALSATSLAVVYAVLVETGLNRTVIGKRLMSATFVTDFGTAAMLAGLPRIAPWFFGRYGDRVIEPEIKLVFAAPFLLTWLGERAHSHAVLPAFILGLVLSSHYVKHRQEQERLRVVAFGFLTPFFFVKGGMNVSLGALGLLFAAKLLPKLAIVYPIARRTTAPHAASH